MRRGLFAFLFFLFAAYAPAALASGLSGSARLVGVSSDDQTTATQSLNQEYAVRWTHLVASSMRGHAALRYHRYGADLGEGTQVWREELQPDALLIWRHAWWSASSNYQLRKSISNDHSTDLIRDRLGLNLRAQALGYPVTNFGAEFERSFNRLDRRAHDTRRTRVYGNATYSLGRANLYYSADLLYSHNRADNLKSVEARQLGRWSQSADLFHDRWRMASSYSLDYRRQEQTTLGSDTALRVLEPVAGLYAQDPSPELDQLDTLAALTDGNVEAATTPPINIGQGSIDQNVGLDLGFAQDVIALYIYTDQVSGTSLRWTVFTSSDGLTWQSLPGAARAVYSVAAFRYELSFDPIKTRYIKAVNGGTNDVLTARVTEVEAYERVAFDKKLTRSRTSHQLAVSSTYDFSKRLQSTLDLNFQLQPRSDFQSQSNRIDVGLTTHHKLSATLAQTLRGQVDWDKYQLSEATQRDRSLQYALTFSPRRTAGGSLSAQTRLGSEDGRVLQETNAISAQTFVQLYPGLKLTSESGYARYNAVLMGRHFTTWTTRFSADTRPLRALDVSASVLYQHTHETGTGSVNIHKRYSCDGAYRVTASVSVRGSLSLNYDDRRRYVIQDYGLNWMMSTKLVLTALSQTDSEDSIVRLRQRIVSLTLTATHRTSVYANYVYTGGDENNRPNLSSLQFGLTTGF